MSTSDDLARDVPVSPVPALPVLVSVSGWRAGFLATHLAAKLLREREPPCPAFTNVCSADFKNLALDTGFC